MFSNILEIIENNFLCNKFCWIQRWGRNVWSTYQFWL